MLEDRLLLYKFKRGDSEALRRIYQKYEVYLLTVATALLNDISAAEDVLHDTFISLAQSATKIKLEGNLRNFLATCVANRCRDLLRKRSHNPESLDFAETLVCEEKGPELAAVCNEELEKLAYAIVELPYEQREVIVLHIKADLMFKQIANLQKTSINTVQSRYRYGIDKLRSLLNSEVKNETFREFRKTNK
jgi:RNA polymerase sigma-70 factor (ECF subfamily)